jgi:DNA-binding transcriptional LysR family regulator
MDASDLKFFEHVVEAGGMSRAADKLNTVQSNVTMRIRALERELGVSLFRRSARGVSLTEAGERLLPFALRINRLMEEAKTATRDDGVPKGRLTIGTLETTAALRLTPFLSEFVATYPAVDLTLRTGTTRELVADVLEHRVEGAFVCGPVDHPDLVQRKMFSEELVLLTSVGVRSLDDYLASSDLRIVVLRAGCSYRLILEAWLTRNGRGGVRLLEFGTLEAIVSCVEAGLGLSLLPRSLIGPVWQAGRVAVHRLPAAEAHVETIFIRRRDSLCSSALKEFLARARPEAFRRQAAE